MTAPKSTNTGSGSTTWAWKRVKVGRPAGGQKERAPKAGRWWGRPYRDPRSPLALTIKLRGGEECWYEVHSRGSIGRFPGVTSIHDMMREINQMD